MGSDDNEALSEPDVNARKIEEEDLTDSNSDLSNEPMAQMLGDGLFCTREELFCDTNPAGGDDNDDDAFNPLSMSLLDANLPPCLR